VRLHPRIVAALPPLAGRDFRLLFAGQAVSVVGDALFPVALAFAVLDLGGSATELGLVLAAQGVPLAVLVLFAGVWADRLPRRWIMFASDLGRAAAQAAAAWLLISGRAEIWHLAALAAVYGAFDAGFQPAAGGLLPQLVRSEHLQQANALMGLARNMSFVVGPALAGVLTAAAGPGTAIAVDAVTFVISAAFLSRLHEERHRGAAAGRRPFLADLRAGFGEVRRRRWMWSFMPAFSAYHLIALPGLFAFGPVIADDELGGAKAWGIITACFGVGTLLGNLVALRVQPERPMLVAAVAFVFAAMQPGFVALGDSVAVIGGLELVAGIAVAFGFGQWETTLGREIPPSALARVTSLDYFTTSGVMPLGFVLVGPVAALVGVRPAMIGASAAVALMAAAAAAVADVRGLRRRVAPREA
jgi:MFS family permease